MTDEKIPASILMAEDDDDDFLLAQKAFSKAGFPSRLYRVKNGEELMDYLYRREVYEDDHLYPAPSFVLLDLNMPRKDGREALREIKGDLRLRRIPVIILTTSESEDDIAKTYELGANCFIRKPVSFEQLVEVVKSIHYYWLKIATLPDEN